MISFASSASRHRLEERKREIVIRKTIHNVDPDVFGSGDSKILVTVVVKKEWK